MSSCSHKRERRRRGASPWLSKTRGLHPQLTRQDPRIAAELCTAVALPGNGPLQTALRPFHVLSQGEQHRASLARQLDMSLAFYLTRMARFTGQAQQRNAHFQHFSGMAQAFQVACAYASQAICIPATKGRQGLGAISSRCRDSRQTMLLRLGRGPPSAATTVALPGARTKGLLTFSSFLSLGERLGFPVIHRGCCVSPTGLDPSNSFGFELPTSGLTCFSAFCNKLSQVVTNQKKLY